MVLYPETSPHHQCARRLSGLRCARVISHPLYRLPNLAKVLTWRREMQNSSCSGRLRSMGSVVSPKSHLLPFIRAWHQNPDPQQCLTGFMQCPNPTCLLQGAGDDYVIWRVAQPMSVVSALVIGFVPKP